jgi:hypothetical protein
MFAYEYLKISNLLKLKKNFFLKTRIFQNLIFRNKNENEKIENEKIEKEKTKEERIWVGPPKSSP